MKRRPLILTSKGDLTPNAPGNPLGVLQVYLLDVGPKLLPPVQVTNSDRDCAVSGVNDKGDMVAITSRGDLVPASDSSPGNAGHMQHIFLLSLKGTPTLRQMTSGDYDVTFQGFLYDGKSFLVQSVGDLVPNDPGNPDGGAEIYRIYYR